MSIFLRSIRILSLMTLMVFIMVPSASAATLTEIAEKAEKAADALSEGLEVVKDKLTSDSETSAPTETVANIEFDSSKTAAAAGAINAFTLDLYGKLSEKEKGNLFFSPYSIVSALGMTYAGASGNTAAEMEKVLHFKGPEIHASMGALISRYESLPEKSGVLATANRLWPSKDEKLRFPYVRLLKDDYRSDVAALDFAVDPDGARKAVNAWVEEKTKGKIKDLLEGPDVGKDTVLILTNAIYFNSLWAYPFDAKETKSLPFFVAKGKTVDLPTMSRKERFSYGEADGVQFVKLPYKVPGVSMLVLLPRTTDKFDQMQLLEQKLSGANGLKTLERWISTMELQRVNVWLPKFEQEQRFSLKDTLEALGMQDAFSAKADFSGIFEPEENRNVPVFINAVIHQTFVAVDEEKTEAAGATAVGIQKMSIALPEDSVDFRADHPFLYLIMDDATGTILFMGRQTFN